MRHTETIYLNEHGVVADSTAEVFSETDLTNVEKLSRKLFVFSNVKYSQIYDSFSQIYITVNFALKISDLKNRAATKNTYINRQSNKAVFSSCSDFVNTKVCKDEAEVKVKVGTNLYFRRSEE